MTGPQVPPLDRLGVMAAGSVMLVSGVIGLSVHHGGWAALGFGVLGVMVGRGLAQVLTRLRERYGAPWWWPVVVPLAVAVLSLNLPDPHNGAALVLAGSALLWWLSPGGPKRLRKFWAKVLDRVRFALSRPVMGGAGKAVPVLAPVRGRR